MSYLAEDFDEIKDLRDQHLKNHPSFEAQNLLTGFVFKKSHKICLITLVGYRLAVHWGVILFLNTKSAGKPIMSPTQRRQTAQDLRLIRDSVKHKKLKAEGLIYFPSGLI